MRRYGKRVILLKSSLNSPERIHAFLQKHHILKNSKVDSLQISIEKALWNKDLTGEIEPFANLDHLLEQLLLYQRESIRLRAFRLSKSFVWLFVNNMMLLVI